MGDKAIRNRASDVSKAEGDRWSSDPGTVERRDRERPESGTLRVHGSARGSAPLADTDDIVNRTGAGFATPRRYDEPEDPENES
jgi:hypothetical protein